MKAENNIFKKMKRRNFLKKGAFFSGGIPFIGLNYSCIDRSRAETNSVPTIDTTQELRWPLEEKQNMPKLTLGANGNVNSADIRKIKQLGVNYVCTGGPSIPWKEEDLRHILEKFKDEGLEVINLMIGGFPNVIYGRSGRDKEIEMVKQSLEAAGKVGLKVVEYNFYVDRLMEGYSEIKIRGGATHTLFDYENVKELPAKPDIGVHDANSLWDNLSYFLRKVIPVAEKSGVRMALHPNDPPVPISHGSDQIMANFDDWKRLIEIIDSPSNGITFDCGVVAESGADPLEVLDYFGTRDKINHVHFRNVLVEKPREKYTEVFLDEGEVNMYAVMKGLIDIGYSYGLFPEHPMGLEYDFECSGGLRHKIPGRGGYSGLAFNVGFAKAMMLAIRSSN